jgi:hypothetical protein
MLNMFYTLLAEFRRTYTIPHGMAEFRTSGISHTGRNRILAELSVGGISAGAPYIAATSLCKRPLTLVFTLSFLSDMLNKRNKRHVHSSWTQQSLVSEVGSDSIFSYRLFLSAIGIMIRPKLGCVVRNFQHIAVRMNRLGKLCVDFVSPQFIASAIFCFFYREFGPDPDRVRKSGQTVSHVIELSVVDGAAPR